MQDKDYQKLIKEYEKLNESEPELYPLTHEEKFADLKKWFSDERFTSLTKEKLVEVSITFMGDDYALMRYYKAFKSRDMEYMNDALFETAHLEQVGNIHSPDSDHGYYGLNITPHLLAANMFDRLGLVLPEENGLGNYSFIGTHIANLLMGILYDNGELRKNAVIRAEKELGKKKPEYLKLHIECMLAILRQDPETFNSKLREYCDASTKAKTFGMNAFNKGFCIEAHGLFNLAKWAFGGQMKDKIDMPDSKNFCQDLAQWQQDNGCKQGTVRTMYPEELDIFNKILSSKPVRMHLKKAGRELHIDTDRYFQDYFHANNF